MSLDAELIEQINGLILPDGTNKDLLDAPAPRPAIGAGVGIGVQRAQPSSGGGGGLVTAYTETERTLHATQAVSSDGLFVWSVPATITMIDNNDNTVIFHYAEPE